jgi:murein DD-endopeptidase MepM/ murein hydrolase activator NlpD
MPLLLSLLLAFGVPFPALGRVVVSVASPSLAGARVAGTGARVAGFGPPGFAAGSSGGLVWPGLVGASAAVYMGPGVVAVPASTFGWPVDAPRIVRSFDPPAQPWLAGHRGVDLAAPPLSMVYAVGAGTVVYAGRLADRGVVSVAHPDGLRTTYEPVTSALHVGDVVAGGQRIGTLEAGHPGCPAVACLHWGLRRGEQYLDPLALLGLGRVRLLPLSGGADPGSG